MTDPIIERRKPLDCKHEGTIAGLIHDRDDLKKSMEVVSTKLDLILAQITKVAILEERHNNSTQDINRAHLYVANLEKEVKTLSTEVRSFISESKGMAKMAWIVWTILSSAVGLVFVKVLFFMQGHPV
jgi:hypothetical protein